jgi:cysteine desulfurase
MAANNETGVLQPWEEMRDRCHQREILFHCDAAQWIGKLPSAGLGKCDFLTGSAHKFGGPKGVGFVKIPTSRISGFTLQKGGPQEFRHRAGTENVAGILAMMAAWEERESAMEQSSAPRDAFEETVSQTVPGVEIVGKNVARLWNTSLIILPEFPNTKWLAALSDQGFALSTGSACSTGAGASDVLLAMGLEGDALRRVIRISSGWDHAAEAWHDLADAFGDVWTSFQTGRSGRRKIELG